jgi:hypothetical protein
MIVLNLRRTAGGVGAVLAAGFVTGRKFVLLSAILADFAGHFKPESEGFCEGAGQGGSGARRPYGALASTRSPVGPGEPPAGSIVTPNRYVSRSSGARIVMLP